MRGEGPFAVIRLEPVRRVAGEVGNQAVGVFLEAPHICSIFLRFYNTAGVSSSYSRLAWARLSSE